MTKKFILPTTLATKPNPEAEDPELDSSVLILLPGEDPEAKLKKVKAPAEKPAKKPALKPAE